MLDSEQPFERMLEVPLAEIHPQIHLSLGPQPFKNGPLAVVQLTDRPRGHSMQRAEERLPVGRGVRERLHPPRTRAARDAAHCAEDPEGDRRPRRLARVAHTEGQVVDHEAPAARPHLRTMRLEHDRREQLDPVGHELPVACLTQLARVPVDREPRRSFSRHQSSALIGRARPDRNERASHSAGDKLVLSRRPHNGYQPATPDTIFRHFIEGPGELRYTANGEQVALRPRAHTPVLLDAGYHNRTIAVPWWDGRQLSYSFPPA
jgi:hypothetical protein